MKFRPLQLVLSALLLGGVAFSASAQVPDSAFKPANPQQSSNSAFAQPTVADAQTRARTHTELAAEYYRQGNYAVALEEIRIALDADSNYVPAFSVQGLIHLELREFDRAEKELRRALDLAPKDPAVKNNFGWFLCQSGKERESIPYFLEAVKHPLYPTPDLAYFNAGVCAMKAGDLDGAETYLMQALRMAKDGGQAARIKLAQLAYRRAQYDLARRQIDDLMRQTDSPSSEMLWLALRVQRKLGDRNAEGNMAAQLRNRYPTSKEYQEFLKGNFE